MSIRAIAKRYVTHIYGLSHQLSTAWLELPAWIALLLNLSNTVLGMLLMFLVASTIDLFPKAIQLVQTLIFVDIDHRNM